MIALIGIQIVTALILLKMHERVLRLEASNASHLVRLARLERTEKRP